MNSTAVITTSHKPDRVSVALAKQAADKTGTLYIERKRLSLKAIREYYQCDNILVVNREKIVLYTPNGEYFFHPSMSVPRIKAIKQGKHDHMIEAMALNPGDTVVDCTLGLGADAIVASYAAGSSGHVIGVEFSPLLAYIVGQGLKCYQTDSKDLKNAMSRIKVVSGDCLDFLVCQPDNSFDVVYFDPMFRFPRTRSSSMNPVRGIVNPMPLNKEMITQALRIARKRVVMKENCFSKEFKRLGFSEIIGGKYSPIAFGIIDLQGAKI